MELGVEREVEMIGEAASMLGLTSGGDSFGNNDGQSEDSSSRSSSRKLGEVLLLCRMLL